MFSEMSYYGHTRALDGGLIVKIGGGAVGNKGDKPDQELSAWQKFVVALVDGNADRWFENQNPRPVSEVYSRELGAMGTMPQFLSYVAASDLKIVTGFDLSGAPEGEECQIPDTAMGAAMLAELSSRGVEMSYTTQWPISHEQSIQLDTKVQLEGQWGTESGTPYIQYFRVTKDASGRIHGSWFVELLASPVPLENWNTFEHEFEDGTVQAMGVGSEVLVKGGFTVGQLSTKLHIPVFIKQLAYMCETPFPSTQIMSMSRDVAFSGVPEQARPTPFFELRKNSLVMGFARSLTKENGGERHFFDGSLFPDAIRFGWRFGEESIPHLSEILPVMSDGCTTAMNIVEDGFQSFRDLDYPAPWDDMMGSPCSKLADYETRGSRLGAPQWIPNTHIGEIVDRTTQLAVEAARLDRQGEEEEWEELMSKLLADGAGANLVHLINTYLYSALVPDLRRNPDALGRVEELANQAIEMEMKDQSTNAMCNLGTAYYVVGNLERAEETLLQVLEREDNFSEAEACHVLALIYDQMGDRDKAATYTSRGSAAGGFEAPSWLQPAGAAVSDSDSRSGTVANPGFCGHCGTAFQRVDQNFCMGCGERRTSTSNIIVSEGADEPEVTENLSSYLEHNFQDNILGTPLEQIPDRFLHPQVTWESVISAWFERFKDEALPLRSQFEGFVNVEQGMIWLSDRPLYSCDTCAAEFGSKFIQTDCPHCGRTIANFASAPIGKGDGTYPIFQIFNAASQTPILAILATEMEDDGYGPMNKFVRTVLNGDLDGIGLREAVSKVHVANLLTGPEFVMTSMGSINFQPRDFNSGNYSLPGLTQLIATGPRNREFLDCAEVRVGWEPGLYEVIAITTASELERVATAGSSESGKAGYFERPEIIAVFVIGTGELQGLLPPFKRLMNLDSSGLTSGLDRWTELQRVTRGDFVTAWANWEFSDQMDSASSGIASESLAKLFTDVAREGYLHQLWNWMETRPPSLATQLNSLEQLGSGFAEVIGWSTQPGGTLTREDLRKWFDQN